MTASFLLVGANNTRKFFLQEKQNNNMTELKIKIKFKKKEDEAPTTVEISRKRLASDLVQDQPDEEQDQQDTFTGNGDTTRATPAKKQRSNRTESGEPKKKKAKHSKSLLLY